MVRSPRAPATSPVDPLGRAFDAALGGDDRPLFAYLTRHSGLPGVRANPQLVLAFASHAATRGASADPLIRALVALDADRAPGATDREILPVCGVAALGARAAADPAAVAFALPLLESAAEDLRFRVRDEVPRALARIGAVRGERLVDEVAGWMEGFFQSAAVLIAARDHAWLPTIHRPDLLLERMDAAMRLAAGADRSAARYPGYKALVDALSETPGALAARFGAPVFDMLVAWAGSKDPSLREVVAKAVSGARLAKRFGEDVARVRRALADTAPTRRDPRTDVGPTRGRSRKRMH